jgi:hypothetical protein
MPKTKLSKSKGEKLLEETKQRLRLQQEAITIARIEKYQQSKLFPLSTLSRGQYWKPLINSFHTNLSIRNPSSIMSSSKDASMEAGQTVSSEAKAAEAVNNLDMELESSPSNEEYNPDSPLRDYNENHPDEEDPTPALKKRTNGKEAEPSEDKEIKKLALREKLAQNGFALRTMLMDEQIQAHYVSPMSTEDEMSVEDMLAKIP